MDSEKDDVFHNIKFVNDVPLILSIEIGRAEMNFRQVLSLKKGTIIELNKLVGDKLDAVINEKLFARGEAVVVNEHMGFRVSEISRPDEKIGVSND